MQKPADYFFAGSAFAFDQDRQVVVPCSLDFLLDLTHSSGASEDGLSAW